MADSRDILLAQLIRRRALVPRAKLAEVVKEFVRPGNGGSLDELLVSHTQLDAAEITKLRADPEVMSVSCPSCEKQLSTAKLTGGNCSECAADLGLPGFKTLQRRLEQTTRRRKTPRRKQDGPRPPTTRKRKRKRSSKPRPMDSTPEAPIRAVPAETTEPASTTPPGLDDSNEQLSGRHIGGYEVQEEIAQGGMGIVYKARQPGLNRVVALKVLKDKLSGKSESIQRFIREARAASRMNHPCIVSIIEVGEADGRPFLTMDYLEGTPLDEMVAKGPIPPRRAVELMRDLSDAMRYAHGCDVVHRDLKPSNIIVDADGVPHITDFGLAKRLDSKSRVTETGALVGTPYYMAPEQIAGVGGVNKSWDTYALGVIFYEMLTGELPFDGETTMEVYHQILNREPTPPRQLVTRIPPPVERLCLKAMAREDALRYRSTGELARDLENYLAGRPVTARPLGRFGRFIRRYDRHAALYTIIACALIIALGSLLILGLRMYRKQQRAQSSSHLVVPALQPARG